MRQFLETIFWGPEGGPLRRESRVLLRNNNTMAALGSPRPQQHAMLAAPCRGTHCLPSSGGGHIVKRERDVRVRNISLRW